MARATFGAVLAVFMMSACTEETIVFRDREPFNPAPDSAFLGLFDVAENQTTCGNCHVGVQGDWEVTAHAGAFASLENSGHAQDFCYGCHTVSELGNAVSEPAGWNAVPDSVYMNVQCESCHGPGQDHVENPDAVQPFASIVVDTSTADGSNGCAECHQGTHHPFAEEWLQSAHAGPVGLVISLAQQDPAHYEPCLSCHSAQGALQAWGVDAEYLEGDDPVADHLGITCSVCHDPHGSANDAQLRFPIDVPDQERNLCVKCHHKRAAPETDAETLRGPHSPEGPLLLGEGAGWFPTGFEPSTDRILGSHGTIGNARTCASCHVAMFEVTDDETGEFLFNATGHLFQAIPCVDAQGIPTRNTDCSIDERQFGGCAVSGCHATIDAAKGAYTTAETRIDALVAEVDALLAAPGPAADFNRFDGVFTTADGAWFNARLGELPGSPTHNPFLMEQLLLATVNALRAQYNLSAPITGISLEYELQ